MCLAVLEPSSRSPDRDNDGRLRERKVTQQTLEPLPREASALTPAVEPLPPGALDEVHHRVEAAGIPTHPEVVEVALQPPLERRVLLLHKNWLPN